MRKAADKDTQELVQQQPMKLVMATTLWQRLTGLLNKNRCVQDEVLLLTPCKSVHTYGMRCALDVAFLNNKAQVLVSERALPPARTRSHPQAVAVLERRSNPKLYWPEAGDLLHLQACSAIVRERGTL